MRTGIGRITIHDVSDGVDGLDGIQVATVSLYKSSFSLPAKPSNTLTYTFSTGQVSGDLSGWTVNVPENTQSGGIIWVTNSTALATASQTTDTLSSASWSTPVTYSINGVDGTNGLHGSGSYIVTVADVASIPSNEGKDANLYSLAGRDAQKGDILTYRDSGDTFAKQYLRDASEWTEFTFAIDGNAIINGTLAAEALVANSITADQIKAGAITAASISTTDLFSMHIEAKSLTFVDGADMSALQGLFESPVAGDNLLPYEYTNVNSSNPPTLSNTEGVADYSYKLPIEGNLLGINALRLERLGNTEAYTYLAENAQEGNIVFLEKGKVTVSFSAYAHAAGTTDVYLYVDGVHVGGTVAIVQGWGEYAVTLDLGNTSGNKGCLRLDNDIPDSAIQSTMFFANIKVEIGTQATPFTQGVGVTATEAENARIAWSNENIYKSQSSLQISGGGYSTNPTQGWGVNDNGYAEFLGGINVKDATIEGATIIGGEIYSGNFYFGIDYNNNGTVDDLRYLINSSIPLSARASYGNTTNANMYLYNGRTDVVQSPVFNVVTCTKRSGQVNANRFRWGRIRANTFMFTGSGAIYDSGHGNVNGNVRILLHHETGTISSPVQSFSVKYTDNSGKHYILSLAGISFDIWISKGNSGSADQGGYAFISGFSVANLQGDHWSTTNDTLNGSFQIVFNFDGDAMTFNGQTFNTAATLTVDNTNYIG